MRIRTIKPEFWTDKKVATWPMETRLCFLAMLSGSDDYGRGHAEAERIAAELFPYDLSRDTRETLAMVHRALETLSATSRIVLYRVGDEDFYQIENWTKHQKVDRPSNSRIEPFLPEKHQKLAYFDGELKVLATPSRDTRETLATGSGIRDQGSGTLDQHTHTSRETGTIENQEPETLPGNEDPTPILAAHLNAGQEINPKAVCRDVQGGENASETILERNSDLSEIPTEREWMDACAMGGVPKAFAGEIWLKYVGDRAWWTRRGWRHNVPMVKKWFEDDRDRKGARNHDGTVKTNGNAHAAPQKPRNNEPDRNADHPDLEVQSARKRKRMIEKGQLVGCEPDEIERMNAILRKAGLETYDGTGSHRPIKAQAS